MTPIIRHLLILTVCSAAMAAEKVDPITTKDHKGQAITIPSPGKPAVLLFTMPDQPQSQQALKELRSDVKSAAEVQVAVIVTGDADVAGKIGADCPFAVAADAGYAISGKLSVAVWPTTVVLDADGRIIAHLGGVPKHYARDLEAYLAFATRKIDRPALDKLLAEHAVVADSPEQVASRHLMVAQRLIDKGLLEQAKVELNQGLKLHPQSPPIQLTLADVQLALGRAADALAILESLPRGAVHPTRLALLKGKALVALKRYDEAAASLKEAIRLNPQPAEAWYELGLVYARLNDHEKAEQAFRQAFESTELGRKLRPSTQASE